MFDLERITQSGILFGSRIRNYAIEYFVPVRGFWFDAQRRTRHFKYNCNFKPFKLKNQFRNRKETKTGQRMCVGIRASESTVC